MAKKININLDEHTKVFIFAGAIALLTLIISYYIVRVHHVKTKGIHSKIAEAKRALVIRKDIATIDEVKKEYEERLYKKLDRTDLRNTISTLARESGVDIISIQPVNPQAVAGLSKLSFKARLKASYNQIGNFVAKIESYPLLTKIENLTVESMSASDNYSGRSDIEKEDLLKKDARANVSVTVSAYSIASK
ncbi:MAG: type 4a pilus biogenesis protein PilO [Candidatus Omnitrophica bacterium]|nr:type 4a pilus biogenesis protein PilO [Candidatus Omnitrophota bacterium]